ncbi:MAG: type VI secretion system protein TssA [Nitrospirae bacterium]|nr:type VI secretion system protein TssA [Nitrospirota bacterium]
MTGAELGRSPIRPDAPAGDDIRDQDIFLDLQAEVNRSQSISSGASAVVDWANVQKMASAILEGKSKDLLVAAYLSVALARRNGPPGAMEGISLLNAMVAEHWDGLFPPIGRLRARRNALSWWMTQMQELLPSISSPELSPEAMEQGMKEIRELNATLGDKDPEGPSLSPLYPLIQGLPVALPAAPAKPASSDSSSAASSGPSSSGSGGSSKESSSGSNFSIPEEGDPVLALEQISPALLSLAERLQDADPEDGRAHFLSRTILWEGIREMPDSEEGVTRIPAPPPHILSALEAQSGSGSEEDFLRFLLSRQADSPFWFDLSFRAGRILESRGPKGSGGAEALRGALRALIARLPGIETLSFSGGELPFLSEEGRAWVARGNASRESGEGEAGAKNPTAALSKVRAALSDGRLFEACDLFEEIRRKEPSPRGRFLLNLELLSAVEQQGRDFPVLSLANVLLEEIERFRLDLWEPALAAKALPVLCGLFRSTGDEALLRRAEELSVRLAALDISGAVRAFQNAR